MEEEEPPTDSFAALGLREPWSTCARAMLTYPKSAHARLHCLRRAVPPALLETLPELSERFDAQHRAVETNHLFIRKMLQKLVGIPETFDLKRWKADPEEDNWVIGALTALMREWSDEGALERDQSMGTSLAALERFLPLPDASSDSPRPRVAVPGAGLGRQAWELGLRGFQSVGVENTIMMLTVSNFMTALLEACPSDRLPICPHVHELYGPTNVYDSSDVSQQYLVPGDEALGKAEAARKKPKGGSFKMHCANFHTLAAQQAGSFDGVLTCFYVDASGDVVEAVEDTWIALKPGGIWANCGPLEYDGTSGGHSSDSVRLCGDELLLYIQRKGFELLETGRQTCLYTHDAHSIFQPRFEAITFVAHKLASPPPDGDTVESAGTADAKGHDEKPEKEDGVLL